MTQYISELERLIRIALRAHEKYLNTIETRAIRRAAKRLGITASGKPDSTK